ncbi:venom metalloproteinase BumaMPs1-like [Haemaphysalis longicornis]
MPTLRLLRFSLLCGMVASGRATHSSVVYPVVLEERSGEGTTTVKINEEITLNLAPSKVFSRRFVLSTSTNKNLFHEEFDPSNIAKHIYHDEYSMTAVSMQDVNGALKINGIINDSFGIQPLAVSEHNTAGKIPHRLFRRENIFGGSHAGVTARSFGNTSPRNKFQRYSNAATPEVYFLCDTAFSKTFNNDRDMITYLAVMLAAVNLRFQSIHGYVIKFLFVGLLRLDAKLEEDFMMMHGNYMDGQPTLLRMMMFTYNLGLQGADIRYLITGRDLTAPYAGRMDRFIAGLAYVGGLCSLDGVAIGEDRPGMYAGVNIMAHELAHSLGCVHDGEKAPPSIPGHKGSMTDECAARHGYIMSYHNEDKPNRFKFSPCCQAQIKLFLRIVSDVCIMNTFNVTQWVRNNAFLPGHWLSPYKFCLKSQPHLRLASTYTMTADTNCKLKCEYHFGAYKHAISHDALDGMLCGPWKRCFNGACI